MRRLKSNTVLKCLVLLYSLAYLLGSFANMLHIPRYAAANYAAN